MLELTLRLVVSLAIVVGLLLLLARFGARKFRGNTGALIQVVHRQPLSRTSSVAVVTVGSRVLVLGTTEQQISVLTELDPDELELENVAELSLVAEPELEKVPEKSPEKVLEKVPGSHRGTPLAAGPLAGSVLSPQTWRQALGAIRRAS